MRLFETRAASAKASFRVTEKNAADVAELVRLLDGMPLAIELAAARAPVMSPAKMVERMGQRFRLLSRGKRGASRRRATLRGAIDWSWDLIEPWERLALLQCSVFQGSFTLEAAEAVLDLDAWEDAAWPADAVQSLVDKSLVRTLAPERGEPRFALYQSIRDYAEEKLGEPTSVLGPGGEALLTPRAREALATRHMRHYGADGVTRAEALEASTEPIHELMSDRDNLAAAFEAAVAANAHELAAGCWALLASVAERVGPVEVAVERFSRIATRQLSPAIEAALLAQQARLVRTAGGRTKPLYERRLALLQELGDEAGALRARQSLACADVFVDPEATWRALGELREEVEASGDAELRAEWHGVRAITGPREETLEDLERAAEMFPPRGFRYLYNAGVYLMGEGRFEEILAYADRVAAEEAGAAHPVPQRMLAAVLRGVALAAADRWDEAEAPLVESQRCARQLGDQRFLNGVVCHVLVLKRIRDGDLDRARELIESNLRILPLLGDTRELACGLSTRAALRVAEGRIAAAREDLDEAYALAPTIETELPHVGMWVRRNRLTVEDAESRAHRDDA